MEEDWNRLSMKAVKKKIKENGRKRWEAGMEDKSTLR